LTRKGKVVRADFNVVATDEHTRALTWAQRIQGTPFARLLSSAETEVRLAAFPPEAPDAADAPDAPDAAALARARAGAQVANATEVNATEARATEVTIELRQTLTGLFPRLGGVMVRRGGMGGWGGGAPAAPPALPPHARGFLRENVGVAEQPRPPVALEHVSMAPSSLGESLLAKLRAIVGSDGVSDTHEQRVLHAAGKGYPDLVRLRAGEPEGAPDAVLYPADHEQVRALLELCESSSIAVVPFGGGRSVVGGVEPLRGEHGGVVSLDMARMGALLSLDGESRTVTVQAGMRAPALERIL